MYSENNKDFLDTHESNLLKLSKMFGFSKNNEEVGKQNVLYFEDFSSKDVNEATVGRKGESLFNLSSMDVPIPDYYVVTPEVYRRFLLGAFEKKLSKLLDKIKDPDIKDLEKIILEAEFPKDVQEDLNQAYARLSGFSNAWVAVRSSVVYPQGSSVSFSGLFHTELSVKGQDQVFDAIKQVYLSVFKNRVLLYARDQGVDLAELQMAVVVQRMVQPEVSGISYTQDPITKDKKNMAIEAVFGLGDVITDGSITPDMYLMEKKNLDFIEKHISPQEWMRIRKPADSKVGEGLPYQKISISRTWSHQQKLEDPYVRDVAKVALIIEDKMKNPQAVEWAWESGNVWVLQNKSLIEHEKPEKEVSEAVAMKSVYDIALDIVQDEQQAKKQKETKQIADKVLSDEKDKKAEKKEDEKEKEYFDDKEVEKIEKKVGEIGEKKEKEGKKEKDEKIKKDDVERKAKGIPDSEKSKNMTFLLSGIGVSSGKITGKIVVVDDEVIKSKDITKREILLIKHFKQEMEPIIIESGGVIMDEGGLTSDVAILSRDIGIPAVTGTGLASALLKNGDYVMIDGNVGSVYKYNDPNELGKEKKSDKKKDKEEKPDEKTAEAVPASEEEDVKESKPKPPTATKVLLSPTRGSKPSEYDAEISQFDGICYVDLDGLMLEDGRHPKAYLKEKKFAAYAKELEKMLDGFADLDPSDEVIVSIGSATVGEMQSLVKGKEYEPSSLDSGVFGAQRLLENEELLQKQIMMVKRARNTYKNRNISLAIHSPVNKSVLTKLKKELTGGGLKRTGTFNVYAIIDTSSEVILIDEILAAGIDGVIVNTPFLALQMQGLSRQQENAKYNIGVNSVWNMVEGIVTKVKENGLKTIVISESSKKLIKNCVNKGVYGVAVEPKKGELMKQYVSDEEAKMVMSIE